MTVLTMLRCPDGAALDEVYGETIRPVLRGAPAGLRRHVLARDRGAAIIVDVWESEAAFRTVYGPALARLPAHDLEIATVEVDADVTGLAGPVPGAPSPVPSDAELDERAIPRDS
jgi:hypothetical protein